MRYISDSQAFLHSFALLRPQQCRCSSRKLVMCSQCSYQNRQLFTIVVPICAETLPIFGVWSANLDAISQFVRKILRNIESMNKILGFFILYTEIIFGVCYLIFKKVMLFFSFDFHRAVATPNLPGRGRAGHDLRPLRERRPGLPARCARSGKLDRARSRLYRSQFLQVNKLQCRRLSPPA